MWCTWHLRPCRAIVLLVSWWLLEASRDIEGESPDGQSPDDVPQNVAVDKKGAFVKQHSLSTHESSEGRHNSSSDKTGLLMPEIVDDEHAYLRSTAWHGRGWRPPLPDADPPADEAEDSSHRNGLLREDNNEESPDVEADADDDEDDEDDDAYSPDDDAEDDNQPTLESLQPKARTPEDDHAKEVYDELRDEDMQTPKDLPQHHVVSSDDPLEALPLRAAFDAARLSLVQPHKDAAQLSPAQPHPE